MLHLGHAPQMITINNVSNDEDRLTILSSQDVLDLATADYGICNLPKLVMISIYVASLVML
jgi:hypothetical protein